MKSKTLSDLLRASQRGDRDAWHTLWLHGEKIAQKIVQKLSAAGRLGIDREDALAEAYLAIGEGLLDWDPKKGSYSTWIWIKVRSAVLQLNRVEYFQGMTGDMEPGMIDSLEQIEEEGMIDVDEPVEVPDLESFIDLDMGLELLSKRQQDIVHLYYFEDLSIFDISQELGVSTSTVSRELKQSITILSGNF